MAASTDTQILRLIAEITAIRDDAILSTSPDHTLIRLSSELTESIDELQAIHEASGEPAATIEYRAGRASVMIGIGYWYDALEKFDVAEMAAFKNLAWQAQSYLEAGLNSLTAAIASE